jgi:hypothetical protein
MFLPLCALLQAVDFIAHISREETGIHGLRDRRDAIFQPFDTAEKFPAPAENARVITIFR